MNKIIAIPLTGRKLCKHFGNCGEFALIETENKEIRRIKYLSPPVHQPGAYPNFLLQQGINTVIAGGMGMKAQDIFKRNKVEIFSGIESEDPEELVRLYLSKELKSGTNKCDH